MIKRIASLALLCLFFCSTLLAQVPNLIAYQGRLVNGTNLVNGTVGLALTLYDGPGTLLYRDSNQVDVVDGLYSTFIGDNPASAAFLSAFTNAELYVETEVKGVTLTPRERIAAVGFAVMASGVSTGCVVPDSLNLPRFSNTFWSTDGNAGTTAGTHFLGTTDDEPLELKVNGARALRLEPTSGTPNLIGGYSGNAVTSGVVGATIPGGGASAALNRVTDDFGTVGGGRNNQAGDGSGTTSDASYCTVGGGRGNIAAGEESVVVGGYDNQALGADSSILGGTGNIISNSATYGTICGGSDNVLATPRSFIGNGTGNQILPLGPVYAGANQGSVIMNGIENRAESQFNFIGSGHHNSALGFRSVIVGGEQNTTHDWFGFIGCGDGNQVYTNYSGVVCGYSNISSNQYTFVGGGRYNNAEGANSTVAGGRGNTAAGNASAVLGGYQAAATHYGEQAHAAGNFAERGDAQSSAYVLRRTSTGTSAILLFLNGGDGDPITLASNRVVAFEALITAAADNGDAAVYRYSGGIKRIGDGNAEMIGTVSEDLALEDDPSWTVSIDANTTDNSLRFRVTGATGRTIRWVAGVRTTETVFP